MDVITYSRATVTDLQDLVDSRIEFFTEFWGAQNTDLVSELKTHLGSYFKRHIPDNSYISYIARAGNMVAGVGGMVIREQPGSFKNPSGRVGYIMNMYTKPIHRRKGICSHILKKLIGEGKEQGIIAFELHATKDGESVYPKHGFFIHGEPTYRKYLKESI